MINFDIHFTWHTYFCIVALVTIWNLGFFAITRKGKLLHPILAFFTKKKLVDTPLEEGGNKEVDDALKEELLKVKNKSKEAQEATVDYFLSDRKHKARVFSRQFKSTILANALANKPNKYFYKKEEDKYSDLIKDPIVACITCMASVHGFILYTMHCILLHHSWNPIEQIAVSVPVAFLGEFFWKLKLKIEK